MTIRLSRKWTLSDDHVLTADPQVLLFDDRGKPYAAADVVQLFASYKPMPANVAVLRYARSKYGETTHPAEWQAVFQFCGMAAVACGRQM